MYPYFSDNPTIKRELKDAYDEDISKTRVNFYTYWDAESRDYFVRLIQDFVMGGKLSRTNEIYYCVFGGNFYQVLGVSDVWDRLKPVGLAEWQVEDIKQTFGQFVDKLPVRADLNVYSHDKETIVVIRFGLPMRKQASRPMAEKPPVRRVVKFIKTKANNDEDAIDDSAIKSPNDDISIQKSKHKYEASIDQLIRTIGDSEMSRAELMQSVQMTARSTFRDKFLAPAMENGMIEQTIPNKPKSRDQKYRLTVLGKKRLAELI